MGTALLRAMAVTRRFAQEFKEGKADASDRCGDGKNGLPLSKTSERSQTTVDYLMKNHKQTRADAMTWLQHTQWICQPRISRAALNLVGSTLVDLGVLQQSQIPATGVTECSIASCITCIEENEKTSSDDDSHGIGRFLPRNSIFRRRSVKM